MQTDGAGNVVLGSSSGSSGIDIAGLLLKALTGQSGSEDSTGSKTSSGSNQSQMIQDLLSQLTGKSSTSGSSDSKQVTDALQTAIQNATQSQNTNQASTQNQTGSQTNQQTGTQAQNTTGSQTSASTQVQNSNQVQNQVQQNNTGSVTTTGSNISAQGMQRLIDQALSSAGGVADIATGAHATGIYNSTTQQQLTNDLITRTAGELAARQAGTTSTTQNSGAITTTGSNQTSGTAANTGTQQNSQQSSTVTDMLNKLLSSSQTQGNVATAVTGQSSQTGSTQNTGTSATTANQNQVTDTSQMTAQNNKTNQTGSNTGTDASTSNTVRKADSPISNIDWKSLLGVGAGAVGASVLGPALSQLLGSLPGANGATGSSAIGNIGASLAQWLKSQGSGSGSGDLTVDNSGAGNAAPDNGSDLRGFNPIADNQKIAPIVEDGATGPVQVDGPPLGDGSTSGNWWEQAPDDWFNYTPDAEL